MTGVYDILPKNFEKVRVSSRDPYGRSTVGRSGARSEGDALGTRTAASSLPPTAVGCVSSA